MNGGVSNKEGFSLRFVGPGGVGNFSVTCEPGTIGVLVDEIGERVPYVMRALSQLAGNEKVSPFLNSRAPKSEECLRIGFEETLPEVTVSEYLKQCGCSPGEVESILDDYELRSSASLRCCFAPPAVQRKLGLLAATWSSAPVIILSDPFQPFSGRWREAFAERVLACSSQGRMVVCVNLSFIPKSWAGDPHVVVTDLNQVGDEAFRKATREITKAAPPPEQIEVPAERNEKYHQPAIKIHIPEGVVWAYRETTDRLFGPIAAASRFLRSWSGVVTTAAFGFLVVVMGVVMFPHLTKSREMLSKLGDTFNWKWSDVQQSATDGIKVALKKAEAPAGTPDIFIQTPRILGGEVIQVTEEVEEAIIEEFIPLEPEMIPLSLNFAVGAFEEREQSCLGADWYASALAAEPETHSAELEVIDAAPEVDAEQTAALNSEPEVAETNPIPVDETLTQ